MNKKGDVFQILVMLILLFVCAVVGLILLTFSMKVTQTYAALPQLNQSAVAVKANLVLQQTAPTTTDYMIFFLFLFSVFT